MKKVMSGILVLALLLTVVVPLAAGQNEAEQSYQFSEEQLSYAVGEGLVGCLIGIAVGVGAVACAGSAANPVTFWYAAGCVSAGFAAGLQIGSECFSK
ncbi:MAG: hypothetical protein ACP5JH_11490 [Bacteroidota bacterium]